MTIEELDYADKYRRLGAHAAADFTDRGQRYRAGDAYQLAIADGQGVLDTAAVRKLVNMFRAKRIALGAGRSEPTP